MTSKAPAAVEEIIKKYNCGFFGEEWTCSFLLAEKEVRRPDTTIVADANDAVCLVMRKDSHTALVAVSAFWVTA